MLKLTKIEILENRLNMLEEKYEVLQDEKQHGIFDAIIEEEEKLKNLIYDAREAISDLEQDEDLKEFNDAG